MYPIKITLFFFLKLCLQFLQIKSCYEFKAIIAQIQKSVANCVRIRDINFVTTIIGTFPADVFQRGTQQETLRWVSVCVCGGV